MLATPALDSGQRLTKRFSLLLQPGFIRFPSRSGEAAPCAKMAPTEHDTLSMALTRIAKFWPDRCGIRPGLEAETVSPVIRKVVERSQDRAGALAYFLILAARTEDLLRSSVRGGMTDVKLPRDASEFIVNGEIQRLNQRIQKSHGITPFPIPEHALIHNRFSSGDFSLEEINEFLEAMQPFAEKSEKVEIEGKKENQPSKQQISREEWIGQKMRANSHLNAMGRFYAKNHFGRQADQMPKGTFTEVNRGEEFRRFFENLHENKLIYHERFTAVVELTEIKLTDTHFNCEAKAVRMCTDRPLWIDQWTFGSAWKFCSIICSGRSLCSYGSFVLWPGAKLVKKVEALLEIDDFEMVETLLWSELPTRSKLH